MRIETGNKTMSPEQAREFANANRYAIPQNMRLVARCVDGRYVPRENMPPLARPGADIGYAMTILGAMRQLGLSMDTDNILAFLVKSAGGIENVRIHTDTHAEDDGAGTCMGCAHFRNAVNGPENYGLTDEDAVILKRVADELLKKGARLDILEGAHGESAVFVVESPGFSLRPMSQNGTQAFVFQKTLEDERLRVLAGLMAPEDSTKVSDALRQVSDAQLAVTVSKIAANLPVYKLIDQEGELILRE